MVTSVTLLRMKTSAKAGAAHAGGRRARVVATFHLDAHARRSYARDMNSRHAAALTLVGWYLMLLPNSGPGIATISPPVWSATRHSYDTAKECEHARAKAVIRPNPTQTDLAFYCIASDDPRLR
jgi:hypothetical protein